MGQPGGNEELVPRAGDTALLEAGGELVTEADLMAQVAAGAKRRAKRVGFGDLRGTVVTA